MKMRRLDTYRHKDMSVYLMDFGECIGYGKCMPVRLVKEELNGWKMYDGCGKTKEVKY